MAFCFVRPSYSRERLCRIHTGLPLNWRQIIFLIPDHNNLYQIDLIIVTYVTFDVKFIILMYFVSIYSLTFTFLLHIILQKITPAKVLIVVANIAGATIDAGLWE